MVNEKRLIDANALLRRLQKRREDFASCWRTLDSMPDGAKAKYEENLGCSLIIEDFPAVDAVEVVHGRWLNSHTIAFTEECSQCGFCVPWDDDGMLHKYNYCPNCSANMMDGDGNA